MIPVKALIAWFFYFYNNGWGYIYGKSGQKWTAAQQAKATRAQTVKWGKRWIGKIVTDCSGAFVYAFKKEGGSIYHGSDTIWKKYLSAKGKLKKGQREDGEPIKPGTAVFLYDGKKRHHIGLYVGNDAVIEAKGTYYGVVVSRLNHWDEWGELKDVDYSECWDMIGGDFANVPAIDTRRMLRQGCKGDDVKALQEALNKWAKETETEDKGNGITVFGQLKVDGAFGPLTDGLVKLFQMDRNLKADGIVGPQTYKALEEYYHA